MSNGRRRTRFAQKTRPRAGILRDLAVDDLESNNGIQNCIACTVSDSHRSRTELNRKTVCSSFYFKMGVSQRSRRQSAACRWSLRLLVISKESKTNETTQAFAVRTSLCQWSSAGRASLFGFTLRFRGSRSEEHTSELQ